MSDATANRPLFVELIGLPGAGKTTVATMLPRRLAERGVTCAVADVSPPGIVLRAMYYARAAWFCATHPGLVHAALRYALAVRPLRLHSLRRLRVLLASAFQLRVSRSPCDVVIAHQGALQELWSLSAHGRLPPPSHLASVLREVYAACRRPPAFVLLDIEATAAVDRMRQRPEVGSRFQRMPIGPAAALLGTLRDRLELLVDSAAGVARASALRLNAGATPSEVCDGIAVFACALLGVDPVPSLEPGVARPVGAPHLAGAAR